MRTILFSILLCGALGVGIANSSADESPAAGKQVELKLKTEAAGEVPYLLYLPEDYTPAGKKWPVMLFLHGRGESNGPLSIVKKWGPPRMAERGDDLKYIIVSPQCPAKSNWSAPEQQAGLLELLDHVTKTYAVDEDRTYLTGLSMGGYGSWHLAADHPDRFAAVAPICGRGNPADAAKLKDLPIWAFHGTKDDAVPFSGSADMVEAIKNAGGTKIKFTIYEGVGHNSWTTAYATPELYSWFEASTRSGNKQP